MVWVTFSFGPVVMVVRMMIAIAMVMPPACGPFPSIRLSTMERTPIMTKVAVPLWLPLSAMEAKILKLEWLPPICMANAQKVTVEHQLLLQKLQEYSHWHWKPSKVFCWFLVKMRQFSTFPVNADFFQALTCSLISAHS